MSNKEQQAGYQWTKSKSDALSMSRDLTNLERMFVIFNKDLYGQNCPFIGASISLKREGLPEGAPGFSVSRLRKRAIEAFCQTRWRYPTVAARVVDETKAVYKIESEDETKRWAERTVRMVSQEGGWASVRERLSRDAPIPSPDGDYCLMYIITRPNEAEKKEITTFDVLMHTHHVFTDGAGIRSILNEFLERLASPLATEEVTWGKEVDRLFPPSCMLVKEEELESADAANRGSRLKGFGPDIGLPVYRPRLGPPSAELRGTRLVTHTFDAEFLPKLLNVGRAHHVKLASVLHATLLKSVHETTDSIPGAEDFYKSGSALDLRNGWMVSPFDQKKEYVNSAVAIHPIEVPCSLFKEKADFWKVAAYIGELWEEIKGKKQMAKTVEKDAGSFIQNWGRRSTNPTPPPTKPRTCPYFVSDPPGSHLLSKSYSVSKYNDLEFVLDSYQLATDQNQAVISARSHSWNDKLTLCLVFNAARNPINKMQEFLEKWRANVEAVCEDRIDV